MDRIIGATVAAALLMAAAPAAAGSASAAQEACKTRLQGQFSATASNVVTSNRGSDRWDVSGTASRKGERGHFDCSVTGYDVTNIETSGWEEKKNNDGAAVAVGAVALAAIIAAASSKRRNHEYDRNQYNDGWNNNQYYDDSYSPSGGVICYRNQRACYNNWNHSYNSRWSQREFGY
jgi:hypothetical protein